MPALVLLALLILFILAGPVLTIVALNTLFGTGIQLTLGTYLATLWLGIVLSGRVTKS